MAVSNAVVLTVRVLAITHILVGALAIIFGIADEVKSAEENNYYFIGSGFGFFAVWTGTWMCISGGLGIPGSTPQRTRRSNLFAAVFMGFSITSALFGGVTIILFSVRNAGTKDCQGSCYCVPHGGGYSCGNVSCKWSSYPNESKITEVGLAAVILALGIIEFGTGIWVAICLCMMRPCCTDLEEREPLVNSVSG